MNELGAVFTLVAVVLQLVLPRRLAIVPLLLTFAWMTRGQVLEVGSADFTVMRIVICVGFLRVLLRGERPAFQNHQNRLHPAMAPPWIACSSDSRLLQPLAPSAAAWSWLAVETPYCAVSDCTVTLALSTVRSISC